LILRRKPAVFGHNFKDETLFELAVTHKSVSSKNNERLEFLGDAVLGLIISSEIINRFPNATEGELTRIRASLVNGEKLAEIAIENDVGNFLLLGEGEKKSGGHRRSSILANAFESLIGAVYLDSDFETIKRITVEIFQPSLEAVHLTTLTKDPKTLLQEHLQALGLEVPEYKTLQMSGPDHDKEFIVECKTCLDLQNQKAKGASKRKAEQAAANETLRKIGLT